MPSHEVPTGCPPSLRLVSPHVLLVCSPTLQVLRFRNHSVRHATLSSLPSAVSLSLALVDDTTTRSFALTVSLPLHSSHSVEDLLRKSVVIPVEQGAIHCALPDAVLCTRGVFPIPLATKQQTPLESAMPEDDSQTLLSQAPRLALSIPPGALSSIVTHRSAVAESLLVARKNGSVSILPKPKGTPTSSLLRSNSLPPPITNLSQEPVVCAHSQDFWLAIVLGALGGGAACAPASSSPASLTCTRFVLPTGRSPCHTVFSVTVFHPTLDSIILTNTSNKAYTLIYATKTPSALSGSSAQPPASAARRVAFATGRRLDLCAPCLPPIGFRRTSPQHLQLSRVPDSRSSNLRLLLRAVDSAGASRHRAVLAASQADASLASFNGAIAFAQKCRAQDWKAWSEPSSLAANASTRDNPIRVSVSAAGVWPIGKSTSVQVSGSNAPCTGSMSSIVVRLASVPESSISLGEGWCVQLRLRMTSPCREAEGHSIEAGVDGNVSSRSRTLSTSADAKSLSIVRNLSQPLGQLTCGGERDYVFNVNMTSHSPIRACVSLVLHRINKFDMGQDIATSASSQPVRRGLSNPPAEVLLRVPLLGNTRLDILDLSVAVPSDHSGSDESRLRLPGARISAFLKSSPSRGNPATSQTSCRVHVPLALSHVVETLFAGRVESSMESENACLHPDINSRETTEEEPGIVLRRMSSMGAVFEFGLTRAVVESDNGVNVSAGITIITIRGGSHVVPFVRAAILRRIADRLDSAHAGNQQNSEANGDENTGSAPSDSVGSQLERRQSYVDQRTVIDALNAAEVILREGENHIAEANQWMKEANQLGHLGSCLAEYDRQSCQGALTSIRNTYVGWRERAAGFWG